MKVLKSLDEVEAAGLSPPLLDVAIEVVKGVLNGYAPYGGYDPDLCGPILLVEGDDDEQIREEVGYPLAEADFEAVSLEQGVAFVGVSLHSNEWGVSWIVPDAPWLDPAVRAKLVAECADEARP